MRFIKLGLICIFCSSLISGCDMWPFCGVDNAFVSEDRTLEAFNDIIVNEEDSYVYLSQSGTTSCEIKATENIISDIKTGISNRVLNIEFLSCDYNHKDITIDLNAKDINAIELRENGFIEALTPIRSENMGLKLSGEGDITIEELDSRIVNVSISGGGNINLGGIKNTELLKINISGSGNVNAFNLPADKIEVNISGSGSCRINPVNILEADISGSGNVYYQGSPKLSVKNSGNGRAIRQ